MRRAVTSARILVRSLARSLTYSLANSRALISAHLPLPSVAPFRSTVDAAASLLAGAFFHSQFGSFREIRCRGPKNPERKFEKRDQSPSEIGTDFS